MWKKDFVDDYHCGKDYFERSICTLSNLLVYFMFLFGMLRKVRLRLEKNSRRLPWRRKSFRKNDAFSKMIDICQEKRKMVLGIKIIFLFNRFSWENGVRDMLWKEEWKKFI